MRQYKTLIREGHISNLHLMAIVGVVTVGKVLNPFGTILVHWGHAAAGLLSILAAIIMYVLIIPILPLASEKLSIIMLLKKYMGRWVGTSLGVFLCIALWLDAADNLRVDTAQIQLVFLPRTPAAIVDYMIIIVTLFLVYLGLEAIARTTLTVYIIMIITAVGLIVLSVTQYDINNMPPLLGPGPLPLLTESALHAGFFGEILLYFALAPYIRTCAQFHRGLNKGYWWSVALVAVGQVVLQLTFPYPTDDHLYFPYIEVAKILYFGRFIQHTESVFAVVWMVVALCRSAIFLFTLCLQVAEVCGSANYRRFAPAIGILIVLGSFIPVDLDSAISFKDIWLQQRGIFIYGMIPVALGAIAWWRKRKEKRSREDTVQNNRAAS